MVASVFFPPFYITPFHPTGIPASKDPLCESTVGRQGMHGYAPIYLDGKPQLLEKLDKPRPFPFSPFDMGFLLKFGVPCLYLFFPPFLVTGTITSDLRNRNRG